jgi:hypothetical protein
VLFKGAARYPAFMHMLSYLLCSYNPSFLAYAMSTTHLDPDAAQYP